MWPGWRKSSGFDRVRPVVSGNAGRYPFGSLDRQGEVGTVRAIGLADHERQPQLAAALARQRQADETAAVTRHEIHVLRAHALRRHDQIALVLAVLVVHEHRHFSLADVLEYLVDGVQHVCPSSSA
jgi:hypothetical protein